MFSPRAVGGILHKVDGTLVIDVESEFLVSNSLIQRISLLASTTAIYSASVVDNAIYFYNLDYHETTPPT